MCFLTGILLPDHMLFTQPHLSFQQHPQDSDGTMSDEDTVPLKRQEHQSATTKQNNIHHFNVGDPKINL